MGVYRCPASGGDAVALSKDPDGISPQESFDGKTVYFASHDEKSTLKKVALQAQPGTESEVDGLPRLSDCRPLDPLSRRYLFCSCRGAQISPLL